jgi:hypothetical protein
MHVENIAENVVAESLVAEIEGLNAALLPVPLPVAGAEAVSAAVDEARSEEVRGLLAAIQRLESVVEEETIALETGKKIDFDDFSTRKSRSMLEFVRLMRARIHLGGEAQVTEEIQKLRQKLERNRAVLERHYDAVREVAAVIVQAMRDAESDGTYSANAAQGGT